MEYEITGERRTLSIKVSDIPDIPVKHTTMIMSPSTVDITYRRDEARVNVSIEITGPRRLKSGALGLRVGSGYLRPSDHPGWLIDLITQNTPEGWTT